MKIARKIQTNDLSGGVFFVAENKTANLTTLWDRKEMVKVGWFVGNMLGAYEISNPRNMSVTNGRA